MLFDIKEVPHSVEEGKGAFDLGDEEQRRALESPSDEQITKQAGREVTELLKTAHERRLPRSSL